MRNMKGGQVTVFIIVAIMIIAIAAMLFMYQSSRPRLVDTGEARAVVGRIVSDCLQRGLQDSLTALGGVGDADSDNLILFENQSVAILYDGRTVHLPSLRDYAVQIGDGAIIPFRRCVGDTESPYQFSIDENSMAFEVVFDELGTVLHARMPVAIHLPTGVTTLQDFTASAPVAFKKVHSLIESYLAQASEDPYLIPVSPLLVSDVHATLYLIDESSFLISLKDPDSSINGQPWTFTFAMAYTQGEVQ